MNIRKAKYSLRFSEYKIKTAKNKSHIHVTTDAVRIAKAVTNNEMQIKVEI